MSLLCPHYYILSRSASCAQPSPSVLSELTRTAREGTPSSRMTTQGTTHLVRPMVGLSPHDQRPRSQARAGSKSHSCSVCLEALDWRVEYGGFAQPAPSSFEAQLENPRVRTEKLALLAPENPGRESLASTTASLGGPICRGHSPVSRQTPIVSRSEYQRVQGVPLPVNILPTTACHALLIVSFSSTLYLESFHQSCIPRKAVEAPMAGLASPQVQTP